MREMSPKQYFEQIGGTSYASVHRHFQKLTEYGWLRMVRTAPSNGPGRPEHLYRATELAVIDDESWAEIPPSIRDAYTIALLEEGAERLGVAATAGTLDGRDQVAGFDRLVVDRDGWREAIGFVNSAFRALSQEQTDAKIRLESSASQPSLLVVTLAAFELASTARSRPGESLSLPIAPPRQDAPDFGHRVGKVLSDRRNLEVIGAINLEAMSPSQLHERIGGASVEGFDQRCKQLARLGWAVKVSESSGGARRGATESFYRATMPDVSEMEICAPVPKTARKSAAWTVFEEFSQQALAAVKAGTFNRRNDRHSTQSTLLVDGLGRKQVVQTLQATQDQLARVRQESRARLGDRAGDEIGVLITSFETPLVQRT